MTSTSATARSSTLLSTNPENEDKPLPARPNYNQLLDANPFQLMRQVFGPPKVFDVVVPLERNGEPFATVHVGVRTTLLRAVYAPWLAEAVTLMGFALGTALVVAFLLSNLALRPLEEISLQLDYWTAAKRGRANEEEAAPKQDMPARVSNKIELHRPAHAQCGRGFFRVEGEPGPDSRQFAGRNSAVHRGWARGAGL